LPPILVTSYEFDAFREWSAIKLNDLWQQAGGYDVWHLFEHFGHGTIGDATGELIRRTGDFMKRMEKGQVVSNPNKEQQHKCNHLFRQRDSHRFSFSSDGTTTPWSTRSSDVVFLALTLLASFTHRGDVGFSIQSCGTHLFKPFMNGPLRVVVQSTTMIGSDNLPVAIYRSPADLVVDL
jgi:hypothetical protein